MAGTSPMVAGVRPGRGALVLGLRVCGCGLLLAMGVIHLYLWLTGFQSLPTIGILFLLNVIGSAVLAVAVPAVPARFLGLTAVLSALFTAGTLGALALSLTVGLFGYFESPDSAIVVTTIVVESAGVLVLAALAALTFRPPARHG